MDKDEDLIYLIYSGSRWMGVLFPGVKRNRPSKEYWLTYVVDYHGKLNHLLPYAAFNLLRNMGHLLDQVCS